MRRLVSVAKREPRAEAWAKMIMDAAQSWGHVGQAFHDRKRGVVSFVGLGDVSLADPEGRIANYIAEEQHNEMRRRCHALLERHFTVPAEG